MRFLQTEWHRHERERNVWEIERGEMRSRIGRLEGDSRTAKHMQESLTKHVKILETALKREREKVRKLTNGENVDLDRKQPKEAAKQSLEALAKRMLPSCILEESCGLTRFLQSKINPRASRLTWKTTRKHI